MSRQGGKLFYSSGGPSMSVYDPVGWIGQPSVGGSVAVPMLMPRHHLDKEFNSLGFKWAPKVCPTPSAVRTELRCYWYPVEWFLHPSAGVERIPVLNTTSQNRCELAFFFFFCGPQLCVNLINLSCISGLHI